MCACACECARVRTYEAVGEELVDGGECHTGDRTAGLLRSDDAQEGLQVCERFQGGKV